MFYQNDFLNNLKKEIIEDLEDNYPEINVVKFKQTKLKKPLGFEMIPQS